MQILFKTLITVRIILVATAVGKRLPSAASLISVIPMTGALVLAWMYWENKGDPVIMQEFTKGALWGILPSILFFLVAFLCFKKEVPLYAVLGLSFGIWLVAALIHQWMLK